jgi:PAS domain S-box-containing protein
MLRPAALRGDREVCVAKTDGSAVRVLIVDGAGLGRGAVEGILDPMPPREVVHAASVSQARELLRRGDFDVIIADESRLRGVLDALFAFVGLFSLDGVVLDTNQAPLVAGGLERGQVVGHRFVDLAWFSHSEVERVRVADALARAARGESLRLETSVLGHLGTVVSIDAAFGPLRGSDGAITHVVGSGVDVTERRKAERALAQSRERLYEAQRVAHVGSWEWDIAKDRVTWSDELYRIYGVDPATHVPTYENFLSSVHEEDRAHTRAVLAKARENVTPFVYDHRILRPDGEVRMLHTRGEVLGDAHGRPVRFVGCCWDITERWEAMRDAEEARRELENVLERVSDGVVALDRQWRYTFVNTCGGRMLGREASSLIGKHIWTEFPEGRDQKFGLAFRKAMEEQHPVQIRDYYPPFDRWFENRIYPSADGLSIFFTDVTEQQKAQDELRASAAKLRALAARLSDIREEERRVIARELHDQVGQALTALKLDLGWLLGQVGPAASAPVLERLAGMEELCDTTLDTTRRISATLRPAILDDLGLPAAIHWQAREFSQRTGVSTDVRVPSDAGSLAPAVALTLFRILQEALTNVARHAAARHVTIGLELGEAAAVLTIVDDGRGIEPDVGKRATSLGLLGMRERALAIGGTLTLAGAPGRGTTVTVSAPLAGREAT